MISIEILMFPYLILCFIEMIPFIVFGGYIDVSKVFRNNFHVYCAFCKKAL